MNKENMDKNLKNTKIISTLGFLSLIFLALIGYLYINNQTKTRLTSLKELDKTLPTAPQPSSMADKSYPQLKAKTGTFLNYPQAEKRSLLTLATAKTSIKPGESFELIVKLNAAGEVVDGVEFILKYDPRLLTAAEEVGEGSFFTIYPQKEVNNQEGSLRVIALQSPDDNKTLNEEVVVTFLMRALSRGSANLNFDLDKTHVAAYGGQELLKQAMPLTLTIQ
ncbi:hypothetical protein A3J78_00310 [Candidatus Beckwithbacteria bacterium RBG_13_35_6]|uniref:Cohesin domain-containing protein n=1 Tax=Candidatus Beckwithbacteria bacterium RBG_13_35_6 TaxID=1797456 RepID=A0A1F5DEJ2_9BACT|nr:MAG: hypothetical protein A3J78_00310 [Candidatus Beckwithbacteria bacterium RBG_13_35_6]